MRECQLTLTDQQKTLDTRKPTAKSERRGGTVSNLIPKVSIFITYSSILYISKLQYNTPSLLPAGFFLKQSSDPSGDQATTKLAIPRF